MRKHRFFINTKLELNSNIILDADLSHYITRVLRLAAGDIIFLFNNSGFEFQAQISNLSRNAVSVTITANTPDAQESPLRIHLAQVLAKGEKMDLIIQKATELGVDSITPLHAERAVMKINAEKLDNKLEHWQKIAIAASGQCWRNYVPQVNPPQGLFAWLATVSTINKLILSTTNTTQRLKNLNIKQNSAITILIGPEGGFSDLELSAALQHNFQAISLGPRILRTETAGLAAISILQAIYGDS